MDRLVKVRTVMSYLAERFRSVYTPKQELSLDEGTMPWRGRLSFKVFQKDKPDKYGIKLYLLAEAQTGFIFELEVYTGVSRRNEDLITGMMTPLLNKGYRLYMDNFYNSVVVCETLYSQGVHVCGTLRLTRGAPK